MSVLVEAISLVVRWDLLAAHYPGGVRGFADDCRNETYCTDGLLARVGFLTHRDLLPYVCDFEERCGVALLSDEGRTNLCVLDQEDGPLSGCDWLQFRRHPEGFGEAWLSGLPKANLCSPRGWIAPSAAGSGSLACRVSYASLCTERYLSTAYINQHNLPERERLRNVAIALLELVTDTVSERREELLRYAGDLVALIDLDQPIRDPSLAGEPRRLYETGREMADDPSQGMSTERLAAQLAESIARLMPS